MRGSTVEFDRTRVIRFGKRISRLSFWAQLKRWVEQSQRGSCLCPLDARLVSRFSAGGGLLLRCPLRALALLAFCCCGRGSGAVRFACFLCSVAAVVGAALAVSCGCDVFRLWSKLVRAKVRTLAASPQQRANKALHPTAYSLRFGRSSRRSGFRRRVSLVVLLRRVTLLDAS